MSGLSLLISTNDRFWPFLAVQAMKSIRDCSTATCDPKPPFDVPAGSMPRLQKADIGRGASDSDS